MKIRILLNSLIQATSSELINVLLKIYIICKWRYQTWLKSPSLTCRMVHLEMWVWWWPESSGGWEVTRLHDLLSPVSIHQQRPVTFVCVIFKFNSLSLKWQNVPGTFCIRMKAFSTKILVLGRGAGAVTYPRRGTTLRCGAGRWAGSVTPEERCTIEGHSAEEPKTLCLVSAPRHMPWYYWRPLSRRRDNTESSSTPTEMRSFCLTHTFRSSPGCTCCCTAGGSCPASRCSPSASWSRWPHHCPPAAAAPRPSSWPWTLSWPSAPPRHLSGLGTGMVWRFLVIAQLASLIFIAIKCSRNTFDVSFGA